MKKQLLIVGALLVSISIIGLFIYYKRKNTLVVNDTTIQQIQYKDDADKNKKLQAEKDSIIMVLNDSIIILNGMIEAKNTQIKNLKFKRNEKTNNIAKFSTIDLSKFISNCYKDSVK